MEEEWSEKWWQGPLYYVKGKKLGRGRKGKKEVLISPREGMKFGSISLFFIHVPSFHPIMPIWRYIFFSFLEEVTLARFSDS
jgi:hypothetical protein